MDRIMKKLLALVAITGVVQAHEPEPSHPFEMPQEDGELTWHVHASWESHYVSEGRDSLDGDGLLSSTLEVGWQNWALGLWFGESPEQSYNEFQAGIAYAHSLGPAEIVLGFSHLRFPHDDDYDNELAIGLLWTELPAGLHIAADAYYSTEAEGAFIEIGLAREIQLTSRFHVHPSIVFAINQGYVSDGHDGANHLSFTLGTAYALTECVQLHAHVAYNLGIDADENEPGDDLLDDFFHVGLSLRWEY